MTASRGARLREMEREVGRFNAPLDNHDHYLAEALQFLRHQGDEADTLEVLRFVDKLWNSPFARRTEQKRALADVGMWLASRLMARRDLPSAELANELGWMRRLVVIRHQKTRGSSAPRSVEPRNSFGGMIAVIEKARQSARESVKTPEKVVVEAPRRVAPDRLPEVVEVRFEDLKAVRSARENARERERKKKPPKPVWLALVPVDALLAPLAKGLVCRLDTPGFVELYDDMSLRLAGAPRSFFVTEVKAQDGRLLAGGILLEPSTAAEEASP